MRRLLLIIILIGSVVVLLQFLVFPHESYASTISHATKGSVFVAVGSAMISNSSKLNSIDVVHVVINSSMASNFEHKARDQNEMEGTENDNSLEIAEDGLSRNEITSKTTLGLDERLRIGIVLRTDNSSTGRMGSDFQLGSVEHVKESTKNPKLETQSKHTDNELLQTVSASRSNTSSGTGNSIMKRRGIKPTSISHMTSLLLQSSDSSNSEKPRSSPRDREIHLARLQIENAPIVRNSPELYASLFRNFSMFSRSYELMERMLKVYIYKEGDKPIFHQPYLRGIYASEGWFMKLMERNKQFAARDPRKAHLFYLPFSSLKLRSALGQAAFTRHTDLERYLKNYTDIIAKKYRFWNRGRGGDHFLVACHDWVCF